MIKSYEVKYRANGKVVQILMYGSDFTSMVKQNSDILIRNGVEVLSVELIEE